MSENVKPSTDAEIAHWKKRLSNTPKSTLSEFLESLLAQLREAEAAKRDAKGLLASATDLCNHWSTQAVRLRALEEAAREAQQKAGAEPKWEAIAGELKRLVVQVEAAVEFSTEEADATKKLGLFVQGVSPYLLSALDTMQRIAEALEVPHE